MVWRKPRREAIKKEAYEKAGEIKKKQEKIREKIAQTMEKWQKDKETRKPIVSDNEIGGRSVRLDQDSGEKAG